METKSEDLKDKVISITAGYKHAINNSSDDNYDFSNIKLIDRIFANSNFYNIWINNSVFENVTFINCTLERTMSSNILFKNCSFVGCIFYQTKLTNVTFENVNFMSGYLRYCTLMGNFQDVSFSFDYNGIKNFDIIPDKFVNVTGLPDMVCPKEGAFIGYKKLPNIEDGKEYIIELEIPEDAKRSSAFSNKCRCSKAKVLRIYRLTSWKYIKTTDQDIKRLKNNLHPETDYVVGEMVYPDEWDDNRWNECSHGIHFFMTEQEAIDY